MSAQLGDLAVHPHFRSPHIIRSLYKQLDKHLIENGYSVVFTTPNEQSKRLNQRLLGIENSIDINFCLGFAFPSWGKSPNIENVFIGAERFSNVLNRLSLYCSRFSLNSVNWSPQELFKKCCDTDKKHFLHYSDGIVAITTIEKKIGIRFFLIKAFAFENNSNHINTMNVQGLLGAIARFHKTPIYMYWGKNLDANELRRTTISLGSFIKPISIQFKSKTNKKFPFDKIELIDLDIH